MMDSTISLYIDITFLMCVYEGWHDTSIRTEPSRYGHLGSVHEGLQ